MDLKNKNLETYQKQHFINNHSIRVERDLVLSQSELVNYLFIKFS